jgi:RNA polymerase sigma factor (sigma-70 family)
MPNYKKIITDLLSNNIDQESFEVFKYDLAARISKSLSHYKEKFKISDNLIISFESYLEDLVQEIFYIILTSKNFLTQIQQFNDEEYTKVFSKWLNTTIRNTVINFLIGKKIINKIELYTTSLYFSSVSEDSEEYQIDIDDGTNFVEEIVDYSLLEEFFSSLDDDEKKVVRTKLHNPNFKQKDIANELCFSEAKVTRIIERLIEKYKKIKK